MTNLIKAAAFLCIATVTSSVSIRASEALVAGFNSPPPQTQPWCCCYWISDNISKEGITKDLEAKKRVGTDDAAHRPELERLDAALRKWVADAADAGIIPSADLTK